MKTFTKVMTFLYLVLILFTSCSKEPIVPSQTNFRTEAPTSTSKSYLSHLSISNDDDSFTDILIYDSSGQPKLGLTTEIASTYNTYTATSDIHGQVPFGTIQGGNYLLTIKNGSTVLDVENVEKLSSNDFAVELSN